MSADEDNMAIVDAKGTWVYIKLRQMKKKFYPDGLPRHIDLNTVWLELERTRSDPALSRHALWGTIRGSVSAASKWRLPGHQSWKESEAVNGPLQAWCRPEILLAVKVLGFCKHNKNVCPATMNDAWRALKLNFILEEPTKRTLEPYWEGANFDDPAWLKAHVHPWKQIKKQPPFNINYKFRADYIEIERLRLAEAKNLDQPVSSAPTTLPGLALAPVTTTNLSDPAPQIGATLAKSIEEPIIIDDEEFENESTGTQETGNNEMSTSQLSQSSDSDAENTKINGPANPAPQLLSGKKAGTGGPVPRFVPISAVVQEKESSSSQHKNKHDANVGRMDRELKAMREKLDQFTQGFQSQLTDTLKDQHNRPCATLGNVNDDFAKVLSNFGDRIKQSENAINEIKNSVAHLGKRVEQNENASEQTQTAWNKLEKRVRALEEGGFQDIKTLKSVGEDRYEPSALFCKNMEIDMLKSQLREARSENADLQRNQAMSIGPYPTTMTFPAQSYPQQQTFFTTSINREREPIMSLGPLFPMMGTPATGPSTIWQGVQHMPTNQMASSHMSPTPPRVERVEMEAEQRDARGRSRIQREEEVVMN